MDAEPFSNRHRPCGGVDLQLHQEAQLSAAYRRNKEEQEEHEMKRRKEQGWKENRDPREDLHITRTTQNLTKEQRWRSQTRTRTRTTFKSAARSGLGSGVQVKFCKQEVRMALIRKTRNQNPVEIRKQNPHLIRGLGVDQTGPVFTEILQNQDKQTRTFEVRSRTTPDQPTASRTRRCSERIMGSRSRRLEEGLQRTRTSTRTRSRGRIHPSVFRGRGQLQLSITSEAEQLLIHINRAKELMGKSHKSCDSYVKLSVTSDLDHEVRIMKTQMVPNNKNPEYDQNFTLYVTKPRLRGRLLVSVFRRLSDTRRSHLIGCMSFGIGSLISSSQQVSGWFQLLEEEYGRSKHLRVTSPISRPKTGLGADLGKTLDSAPDTDQICSASTSTTTTQSSSTISSATGSKETVQLSRASRQPLGPVSSNTTVCSFVSTQRLVVKIVRGKDSFGFTICSDSPVRVQAVDPGGPAHQSGLHQGDSVLQLNGLPVETWKCVDLAHAIRCCPSQIVLVVWRGSPGIGSGCETLFQPPSQRMKTGSKFLPRPSHSKHGCRRGQGSGVRSSLEALGSLWKDRKNNHKEEEEEQEVFSSNTIKGTCVTSSNGDNYIILSPVNSEEELLHPLYHNRNGTIGRLYQTHPRRGQSLLQNHQPERSQQPLTCSISTMPCPRTRITAPGNQGNYQNCTIMQSHLPHSGLGNYISLEPKTLIFPIFVKPLDLCSPGRTLLMSEEMVLHQAGHLPDKIMLLIYSDLLLLTREDEAGRCNVLQSPLYLNTLQLREEPSEPLHIYFLLSSQSCWRCIFSLEAFSMEQKIRVNLCLHDNIHLQQVTMGTDHSQQLPDLPSDFGLLSLHQSDLPYRPPSAYASLCDPPKPTSSILCSHIPLSSSAPPLSSPPVSSLPVYVSSPYSRSVVSPPPYVSPYSSSTLSPIWKKKEETEEERKKRIAEEDVEERQQGEGESASETSENGGVRAGGLLLNPHHFGLQDEDEVDSKEEGGEVTFRPAVLRRSLSEGSLLQEPPSPHFLSDSTIHCLTRTATLHHSPGPAPNPPSPQTLRKQLLRDGMTLHTMLLLLNGTKAGESRNHLLRRKKTRSLVADVRSRLAFLGRRKSCSGIYGNSLEKALRNNRPSTGEVLKWAESLEALLTNQYGLAMFRHFLKSEFSEENLDFWLAVERYKNTRPFSKMAARAETIYNEFISANGVRQVNVDSFVRESTNQSLQFGVSPTSFQQAQDQIFTLMESDSYQRFLKSRLYTQLANQDSGMTSELPN
uniref:Regulator of G-protein signaling 3a n=1 Tax=Nothobranchius furzeri TaxID=105023 RepID=A0A1A8U2U1_NOTFU